MTEAQETVDRDEELLNKYLPDGAEELVEDSLFTKRELVTYLLWKDTNMTFKEAGNKMGITYGTFSGKTAAIERKKRRAEATMKLIELIEGDD